MKPDLPPSKLQDSCGSTQFNKPYFHKEVELEFQTFLKKYDKNDMTNLNDTHQYLLNMQYFFTIWDISSISTPQVKQECWDGLYPS